MSCSGRRRRDAASSGLITQSSCAIPSADAVTSAAVVTTPSSESVTAGCPFTSTQSIDLPVQKWLENAATNFATRLEPITGIRAASLTPLPSV